MNCFNIIHNVNYYYFVLGIREKVPYFKSIGVGAVWLSPIFLSPQNDFGYDVSDYKEIDPIYGSITDFERMRDEFHKNSIIIDHIFIRLAITRYLF